MAGAFQALNHDEQQKPHSSRHKVAYFVIVEARTMPAVKPNAMRYDTVLPVLFSKLYSLLFIDA